MHGNCGWKLGFSRKRAAAGAVIAAVAAVTGFARGEDLRTGIAGLIFAPLIAAAWSLRFKEEERSGFFADRRARAAAVCAFFLLGAWGIYCYSQLIVNVGHILYIGLPKILLELCLILLIILPLFFLTGRPFLAVSAASCVVTVLCAAGYFVYRFRGTELMPLDIFSARTALGVSGEYSFTMEPMMYCGLLLWLVLLGVFTAFPLLKKTGGAAARIAAVVACPILFIAWYLGSGNIYIETWGNNGSKWNGFLLNFSLQVRSELEIKRPDGYSAEALHQLEEEWGEDGETGSGADEGEGESEGDTEEEPTQPDIILILEESFADLSALGSPLRTAEPVTPYWDSLKENTTRGYVLSSVYGGGTANTEFEVLTGNTMGFLSYGATPYQLYIHEPSWSMASWLKEHGYACAATHPYLSGGWSRTKVYPLLGFDSWSFLEDYPQQDLIRDYVSDREMFQQVTRLWEQRDTEKPFFLFGITMQNHGGFDYEGEGVTPCMPLEGYAEDYPDAEQYLGLIHESDKAIEELISYFEKQERDVVIAIFGDHFPSLDIRFYEEIHGGPFDTLDEQEPEYSVPFVIWTNFDREEKETDLISMSDLGTWVLDAAGLPLPPYNRFRQALGEVVPVWNSQGFYSKSAGGFLPYAEAAGEEKEWLETYRMWQYNYLFDRDGQRKVLFP